MITPTYKHRFSVAPMMERTDRHFRYFLRLISRRAFLYTEMVTSGAVLYGDRNRFLGFHECEHPIGLQLGGSDPHELAEAAKVGEDFGYDEINLNVGCPSDRVQSGRFGACLMAEPDLVATCVSSMRNAVDIPITVKCRIGIDDQDSESDLNTFIETVLAADCPAFTIHARKALLGGLSPKENRTVPPLDYERVYRLKENYPEPWIVLNGGIESMEAALTHLNFVDGVMLGRAAYHNPYLLASVDRDIFHEHEKPLSRIEVVEHYLPYVEEKICEGVRLHQMTRHILGLFQGQPGARAWRRHLSEFGPQSGAGTHTIVSVLRTIKERMSQDNLMAAE